MDAHIYQNKNRRKQYITREHMDDKYEKQSYNIN